MLTIWNLTIVYRETGNCFIPSYVYPYFFNLCTTKCSTVILILGNSSIRDVIFACKIAILSHRMEKQNINYTFDVCVYSTPWGECRPITKKANSKYWHVGEIKEIRGVVDICLHEMDKLFGETEHKLSKKRNILSISTAFIFRT